MNRRSFMQLVSGLLIPTQEPVRAYSFVGGWQDPYGSLDVGIVRIPDFARSPLYYDQLREQIRKDLTVGPTDPSWLIPAEVIQHLRERWLQFKREHPLPRDHDDGPTFAVLENLFEVSL